MSESGDGSGRVVTSSDDAGRGVRPGEGAERVLWQVLSSLDHRGRVELEPTPPLSFPLLL